MDDDFNSPQAVAVIFDFVRDVNKTIAENENIYPEFYLNVKEFLRKTAENVLGIVDLSKQYQSTNHSLENELTNLLIQLRTDAKKEKNYTLSDKIRDELNKLGVILQDSKEKTTYKFSKKWMYLKILLIL